MSAPHVHPEGTEEIWTKLTPGTSLINIGSELREVPENGAYLAPPTGITSHANLNTTGTKWSGGCMWRADVLPNKPAGRRM